MRDTFETSGAFPGLFVMSGPAGSGKTALIQALLSEMCDGIGISKKSASDFIMEVRGARLCHVSFVLAAWGIV